MIPDIQEGDIQVVSDILRSGMLVQGKFVELLEKKIADYIGAKHAIAVSNGTATMHIALKVLGIGPGDEVIVPAFSYVATANVVELVGATPIFVDIDLETFNIDVAKIEQAITSKTKAIIPVHEFGLSADMKSIHKISQKHHLFVIEDAACALGAKQGSARVGGLGHLGSFSFHPRKAITSGEGGVITTNDDEYAKRCRILRNHGIDSSSGKMEFVEAGFNYRMTEFQAGLVLSQFERLNKILSIRNELAQIYLRDLKGLSKIKLPSVASDYFHTFQTFHIVLDESLNRDALINYLKEHNIGANYGAQCIPLQRYYADKYVLDCEKNFPDAVESFKYGLALPLYEKLSHEDIFHICKILKGFFNE